MTHSDFQARLKIPGHVHTGASEGGPSFLLRTTRLSANPELSSWLCPSEAGQRGRVSVLFLKKPGEGDLTRLKLAGVAKAWHPEPLYPHGSIVWAVSINILLPPDRGKVIWS